MKYVIPKTIWMEELEDIAKDLFQMNRIQSIDRFADAFIISIPITMTFRQAARSYRKYGKIKVPRKVKKKIYRYKLRLNRKYGVRITNLWNE